MTARDEVCDAVHEGVKVERGVEGVGETLEKVELQGFDADVRVGGVGVKEDALAGWGWGADGVVLVCHGVPPPLPPLLRKVFKRLYLSLDFHDLDAHANKKGCDP